MSPRSNGASHLPLARIRRHRRGIQSSELLAHHCRGQRQVVRVAHDRFLPVAAQHVAQELAQPGIHRAARPSVDVEVKAAHERVAAVLETLATGNDVRRSLLHGERDGLQSRHLARLRNDGPRDAVSIVPELVGEHMLQPPALVAVVVRDHLAAGLDVLAIARIPFVAVAEHPQLEEARGTGRCMPIGLDRLVGPLAGESELAPGADVEIGSARPLQVEFEIVEAAIALGAEDPVELSQRESVDGVIGMDVDHDPGRASFHVVGAGGHGDLGRVVAVGLVERQPLGERGLAAVGREVGDSGHEGGKRRVARDEHVAEDRVGMMLAKALFPDLEKATEAEAVIADHAAHARLGPVGRQRRRVESGMRRDRKARQRRADRGDRAKGPHRRD